MGSPMADRRVIACAGAAVAVLAGAGVLVLHPSGAAPSGTTTATGTARVVRTDVAVHSVVSGTLAYLDPATLLAGGTGTLTWLPPVGTVVGADARLYEVDGRAVPLWIGDRPAWRDLAPGVPDGPDVTQLERNLAALGFGAGLTVDGHFTATTATAIRRWQAAHGLPRTGVLRLGDVVFRPAPVRVAAVPVVLGTPVSPGTPVLAVTSTVLAVVVALDPVRQSTVQVGDQVSVVMPGDRQPVSGRVTAVGSAGPPAGNGGNSGNGSGGNGAAAQQSLTVPVTIGLEPATGAGRPDAGPVQVTITGTVDRGVLAVPIDALLAAPGGGYQVAVLDGTQRRLVTVHTGLFDESDALVEVAGVPEGAVVEVPAS